MVFGFGKKSEKSELEHASPGDTVVGLPPSPPDVVDGNVPAKKQGGNFMDTESVVSDVTLVAQQEGLKPTFVAKCNVINRALAEIGMGKYQWELFFAGGFGWFADNICELHSSVWSSGDLVVPVVPREGGVIRSRFWCHPAGAAGIRVRAVSFS